MRGKLKAAGIGFAAIVAATQTVRAAAEPAGLDCMAASYDGSEQDTIEGLAPKYGFGADGKGNDAVNELAKIAGGATKKCADKLGWTEEELAYAAMFEVGRVGENALRHSPMLTSEQLDKIDAALAKGNRDTLWAAIERSVWAGTANKPSGSTGQDEFVMGAFVMGVGVGSDDLVAKKTGLLLGMMGLQRIGRREFSAVHEGK